MSKKSFVGGIQKISKNKSYKDYEEDSYKSKKIKKYKKVSSKFDKVKMDLDLEETSVYEEEDDYEASKYFV